MKKQYCSPQLEYVCLLTEEKLTRGEDTWLDTESNPFFAAVLEDEAKEEAQK